MPLLGDAGGLTARLRLPPLAPGQAFASAYEVVLLVDQREQLARGGMGRNGALMCVRAWVFAGGRGGASKLAHCLTLFFQHSKQSTEALDRHLAELRRQGVPVEKVTLNCGDMLWVARSRTAPANW